MTIFITLIFSPKIKAAQAVSSTAPSQLTQLETEIIHLHSNILPGLNIGMEVLVSIYTYNIQYYIVQPLNSGPFRVLY